MFLNNVNSNNTTRENSQGYFTITNESPSDHQLPQNFDPSKYAVQSLAQKPHNARKGARKLQMGFKLMFSYTKLYRRDSQAVVKTIFIFATAKTLATGRGGRHFGEKARIMKSLAVFLVSGYS